MIPQDHQKRIVLHDSTEPPVCLALDRHIYLSLIDSVIMAGWMAFFKSEEAQALYEDSKALDKMMLREQQKGRQDRINIVE